MFFLISPQTYVQDTHNEYSQHMFSWSNEKNVESFG